MKLSEDELPVTQYLRPNGIPRQVYAPVGKAYVEKAQDMIASAEQLTTGEIVIYLRHCSQALEEEMLEICPNDAGPNNPTITLQRMIDKLWEKLHDSTK